MKKETLYYGIIAALIMLLVKGADYSLFSKHISLEIYSSILVLLFTGIGIWFGLRYTSPKVIIKDQVVEHLDATKLKTFGISDREIEVLNLIAAGHTNQQIADQLYISLSTVKSHIQKIYHKLEVKNRTKAIQKAKLVSLWLSWSFES